MLYSEFDPGAAAWLRELMKDGMIPEGEVDERDIRELQPADIGSQSFHAFAGIGGWPYALRLAGWPEDRPVWTGSCPCQPFSAAGKRKGKADSRHVWPEFFRLIAECRPPTIFGEQVASDDGCEWLAGVFADLETVGYRVAGSDLCSAGVGAPHIRQRLYWVADATDADRRGGICRAKATTRQNGIGRRGLGFGCDADGLEHAASNGRQQGRAGADGRGTAGGCGDGGMGLAASAGDGAGSLGRGDNTSEDEGRQCGPGRSGATHWSDSILIPCRDGKARRVPTQPALFPLADGIPGRVGLLRGAGNAIDPRVAALFIRAVLEARGS